MKSHKLTGWEVSSKTGSATFISNLDFYVKDFCEKDPSTSFFFDPDLYLTTVLQPNTTSITFAELWYKM